MHFEKVTLTVVRRTEWKDARIHGENNIEKIKGRGLGLERANILSLGKEG